ncbi:Ubiquitin-conjugating enzyme family protein [Entamoeba marina]
MTKRITGEFAKLQKMKEDWFKVSTYGDDVYKWKVIVDGPAGTPYEGGKFELKIELPKEYPHKPPALYVQTKVYTPIVNPDDKTICAPILQSDNKPGNWAPTNSVYDVILVFRTMLGEMNTDHVSDAEIAQTAKEYTQKYAK